MGKRGKGNKELGKYLQGLFNDCLPKNLQVLEEEALKWRPAIKGEENG